MQYAGIRQIGFTQEGQRIRTGSAGMNDNGLTRNLRRLQMDGKRRLLLLGQLRLIVVVQPSLTNGHGTRMVQRGQQPVKIGLGAVF